MVKLETFKKIDSEALIYGFPFTVFFVLIMWIIIAVLIIIKVPLNLKIVWGIITIAGIFFVLIVFKKYGLKLFLKNFDLYFKNIDEIKFNEPIIINKRKLKK